MADARASLEEAFRKELSDLTRTYDLNGLLDSLPREQARFYGCEAARRALAPLVWRSLAGEVLDTSHLCALLSISRQALAQRVARGKLLGLPSERTTLYPVWQFDGSDVRPVVVDGISSFRAHLGDDVDPLMIASWAQTPQPELDDEKPASRIAEERYWRSVVVSAERAAESLSR